MTGRPIVIAAWIATGLFGVSVLLAIVAPSTDAVAIGVSLVLFFVGSGVGLYAFGVGIVRSAREQDVTVANLFLLQGSAPRPVRRQFLFVLLTGLAIVAVSTLNLSVAPFAWLALMIPVGFPGLWAARHGTFPPRVPKPATRSRR